MPLDTKYYRKQQRTLKLAFDVLWIVVTVLIVGLLLIWVYDKLDGSFLTRTWEIIILIIFAILAALTRVPDYIRDMMLIEQGDNAPAQGTSKPKLYAACLDHAQAEKLIDDNNRLQVPRSDFVRFCVKNGYFFPHRKENWKAINGILKDSTGEPVSADKLAQTYQDIQSREGFSSK